MVISKQKLKKQGAKKWNPIIAQKADTKVQMGEIREESWNRDIRQ